MDSIGADEIEVVTICNLTICGLGGPVFAGGSSACCTRPRRLG